MGDRHQEFVLQTTAGFGFPSQRLLVIKALVRAPQNVFGLTSRRAQATSLAFGSLLQRHGNHVRMVGGAGWRTDGETSAEAQPLTGTLLKSSRCVIQYDPGCV